MTIIRGALENPRVVRLMTIPGIGPVVASTVLASIGDISRFETPEKLSCYFGLTPKVRFSCVGLWLLELKLQLVEQPRRALGARPIDRAPQLFDLKIEMRVQRATLRQFSDGRDGARLLRRRFGPRRNQRRFQRIEVVRKRGKISVHESHGITKSAV